MNQHDAETRVPDIVLERYRLNELPAAEYTRVSDRLRDDAALRLRLASLEQSDIEIRRDYQPDVFVRRIAEPSIAPSEGSVSPWAIPALVATAAVVVAIVLPLTSLPAGEGDRIKGLSPGLSVYRKTERGSETLADGAVVHRGDLIRLGYRAAGRRYGVILSTDGRGVVTVHLPPNDGQAALLDNAAIVLLDRAYELDDAPRWERFYFVTGETAFAVETIMDAARRSAVDSRPRPELELPRGLEQTIFLLRKEEPR
jgi:hypothetical protein